MPSISLVTFAGQTVTPQDDSLVYESALGDGGIIYGAQVTLKNANTLHIASGHGIIAGRKFTVYESDIPIVLSSAGVLLGRLYIHMDLSNASDPIEILTETGSSLSPLVQDEDVNIVNGVFEFNLATFNVSTSTIGDLRNVYPRVQYANSGSFIFVTANNPSLIGQEVQITDGRDTIYAIFDANGVAELRNVFMTGTLQLTATDGTYTAGATLNVPYYGTYNVTMAFWLATLSITTTTPELYNQQITVKNSSDEVVGTTTFNSVGAASFIVSAPDTYTLSIVSGGNTYTSTVNVTAQTTYDVTINAGFQWADWVTSGGLNPSSYGSLADVLVDEAALRRLFLVHNSVDYMAEISNSDNAVQTIINTDLAAKWINLSDYALDTLYANAIIKAYMDSADKYFYGEWGIVDDTTTPPTWGAKGNVPIMTANNAPYGEAIGEISSGQKYMPFNGVRTLDGADCRMALYGYVGYKFTNPVSVRALDFLNAKNEIYSKASDFDLIYSDDGTNWSTANAYTNIPDETLQRLKSSDKGYHLYWAIQAKNTNNEAGTSGVFRCHALQFYGRELKELIPLMLSNTVPYGEAGGDNISGGDTNAYKAFGNVSQPGVVANTLIWYDFKKNTDFRFAQLTNQSSSDQVSFKFQYSDDKETWTDCSSSITLTANGGNTKIPLNIVGTHRYFGIKVLSVSGAVGWIWKANVFGKDYSEKEFETGTTKKWLYDHGLELVDFGSPIVSGSAIAEKQATQFYGQVVTGGQNSFAFAPTDAIDLTDYDLLMARAGDRFTVGNSAFTPFQIGVKAARTYSYSDSTMLGVSQKGLPLTDLVLGLDISSINQSAYPMYADSTSGAERSGTIKEIWLE